MIVLIMGVSGSGKTSVGNAIAHHYNALFLDADDFHSSINRQKMSQGQALTDEDRLPWLQTLNKTLLREQTSQNLIILACSALKKSYRKMILNGLDDHMIVFLQGNKDLLKQRLEKRSHEFFNSKLLNSQLATLEPPNTKEATLIEITDSFDEIIKKVLETINRVMNNTEHPKKSH